MPVTFEELSSAPSPEVTATHTSFEATRRFKIEWDDSVAFYKELMGFHSVSGGVVSYTSPAYFPGVPECICRSVTFTPFPPDRIETATNGVLTGVTATTNQPLHAFVVASYSTQSDQASPTGQPSVPAGTFANVQVDIGSAMLAIPGRHMYYEPGGGGISKIADDVSYGVMVPTHHFTIQWSRVPVSAIPWSKINDATGKINSATFNNYEQHFVLFHGAQIEYEYQFTGEVIARLNYKFTAKKVTKLSNGVAKSGWTHLYIPSEGDYQKITNAQNELIYKTYAFANLFTYA